MEGTIESNMENVGISYWYVNRGWLSMGSNWKPANLSDDIRK